MVMQEGLQAPKGPAMTGLPLSFQTRRERWLLGQQAHQQSEGREIWGHAVWLAVMAGARWRAEGGGRQGGGAAPPASLTWQRCWIAGRRLAPGRATPLAPTHSLSSPPRALRPLPTSAAHGAHPTAWIGPAGPG